MFAALLLPFTVAVAPLPAVDDPPIQLWISNDRRFLPGDAVRVHVRTDDDGYLLVLHVDPDGRVRVLFPLDPDHDNFVRGGKRYEVHGRGDREAFEADITGQGTVYAAVSRDPFRVDRYVIGDHWDYRALAPQRLPREPEAELTELVREMAQGSFDYDVLTYNVIERVYASSYSYRPSYHVWHSDPICDPFYYDYYCRPYYGSSLSIGIFLGSPYRRYRHAYYDPFYYDPYFYRPVYVYPRRYYGYGGYPYYRYPFRSRYTDRYDGPNRFRPRGGYDDDYRDRRYTFRQVNEGARSFTAGRSVFGAASRRRLDPSVVRSLERAERRLTGTPTLERRPAEGRRAEARGIELDRAGIGGGEPRRVEGRRAEPRRDEPSRSRPSESRRREERPNIYRSPAPDSRAAPRNDSPPRSEPRRVERAEPQWEPRAEPRREPRAEPRMEPRAQPRMEPRRDDGNRGGGGGGSRPGGHDRGGGGGRRRA